MLPLLFGKKEDANVLGHAFGDVVVLWELAANGGNVEGSSSGADTSTTEAASDGGFDPSDSDGGGRGFDAAYLGADRGSGSDTMLLLWRCL